MQHFLPWVELCRQTHLRLPVEGLLADGADPAFRGCPFNLLLYGAHQVYISLIIRACPNLSSGIDPHAQRR
jgi:hypothetical protein